MFELENYQHWLKVKGLVKVRRMLWSDLGPEGSESRTRGPAVHETK